MRDIRHIQARYVLLLGYSQQLLLLHPRFCRTRAMCIECCLGPSRPLRRVRVQAASLDHCLGYIYSHLKMPRSLNTTDSCLEAVVRRSLGFIAFLVLVLKHNGDTLTCVIEINLFQAVFLNTFPETRLIAQSLKDMALGIIPRPGKDLSVRHANPEQRPSGEAKDNFSCL